MDLSIIILAAGQGTRMRSARPKVLHALAGRPLLDHVLDTALALDPAQVLVVHGHGGETVRAALGARPVEWVEQAQQLGTGHAVAQALPAVPDGHRVLVLYGDVPLIRAATLRHLADTLEAADLALLTAELEHPAGYGRILREPSGRVTGIVEERDATDAQRAIREINTGFMAAQAAWLKAWVGAVGNANAQGEYYLTDAVGIAAAAGRTIHAVQPESLDEILGVNDRIQLAHLERRYQRRLAHHWMAAGVSLVDPERFDLRGTLTAGRDVTIDANVILEGDVVLGDDVYVGPNTVLKDARLEAGAQVLGFCHIEGAVIGPDARIGPYARLRPETRLGAGAHVGNFVEIKKSSVGEGSKINHLSYVGDTRMGARVNVGAGTITCNYDGANKHQTVIGDDVFIGSDTQLIAPVNVGDGATLGAGTTLTRDAPAGELTLSRARQETRTGWKRPTKKR